MNPKENGVGPVIRTDNGPQIVSHVFEEECGALQFIHERIPLKCPNKNAHIESYHSQLERDLLMKSEFASFEEAYDALDRYLEFYNNR
ncbi:integrase core domain-containing protein [Paenibacillus periandrae]|uniref:integrase core domain-containing protein n=1 Tax=Paenibacillus periandrae TaxID=1761741 RepID=UPI001F09B35C|nr:integrase core domain-containing protein [Paenibacillus periandrae]